MGVSIRPPLESIPQLDWEGTERYEVTQCLGRGGMGAVYEARDRESHQRLALKTLLHATPAALYRFKQEFRTLADVDHPNLVRLHELVMSGSDRVFFTMELVRGVDFVSYVHRPDARRDSKRPPMASIPDAQGTRLTESQAPTALPFNGGSRNGGPGGAARAKRRSPADFDRLRSALRQLVEGVMALHSARKLHRDIKPSNVLVTPEGRVVLLDFGVATEVSRVVDQEMRDDEDNAVGTAAYMAPEQAFEEPSPAGDWYSVGVMLYEAIVGRPPFTGPALDVLTMKSTVDPLPPSECVEDVPLDLDALCRALLHREPAMRPLGPAILRRLGVLAGPRADAPQSGVLPVSDGSLPIGLTGREPHLRELRDAFQTTLSGRTVTVRVGGRPGMGKSALVHRFLDELVEQGRALVLRGRAYESEAVPYKAVDGIVDALSSYLMCLKDDDLAVALPPDIWALARLFPVLRRVPRIGAQPEEAVTDPQRVRRRAFLALRELLGSLARRRPLVVFVDDAQWGDTDSAALLLEVIRPPQAPPLLLTMTMRQGEENASPFLRELTARWPEHGEVRDLEVGPLGLAEARKLAMALVGSEDETTEATVEAIARESGGSPFLVQELARTLASHARIQARVPLAVVGNNLEQMVNDRIDRLTDDARGLLEVIAVSGHPVPTSVAIEASGVQRGEEAISLLRARRFVRQGLRDGREVLEVIHSRIRDTIVARVAPSSVRDHHGRLARALEARGDADVEALTTHFFAAGQNDRAAQFAERAGEHAASKLAFGQAAHLLRLAIDALPASSVEGVRLRKRLGEVLEWAGRSAEAARVYLEAAECAPPLERVDLQRAAAEQFHASGLMVDGTQVLHEVLAATGMRAPVSGLTALCWLIIYRLWLRLAGAHFRLREVSSEERMRLDALYAVAAGFALVDHMRALSMKTRVLVAALRAGDRLHVARSAALVASDMSSAGNAEHENVLALYSLAKRLAGEEPNPSAKITVRIATGLDLFWRGRFREARDALDPIQAMLTNRRVAVQSALLFTLMSIHYLGDLKDLAERYTRALVDAEERGNVFVSVAVRVSVAAAVWLAADDPDRAKREIDDAMAQWRRAQFSNLEWRAALYSGDIDLYVGDAEGAYQRVKGLSRALRKNYFLFVQYVRVLTAYVQGRAAVGSLRGLPPAKRRGRLAQARRYAKGLENERLAWASVLAAVVRAGVAHATGDRSSTVAALRAAIEGAETNDLALHAAAARHELGLLLGGDQGATLVREAERAMAARGVSAPARYSAMLVPGLRG